MRLGSADSGQRSRQHHHSQGLRPAGQGLRTRLQRPAAARRRGRLGLPAGRLRTRRAPPCATRRAWSADRRRTFIAGAGGRPDVAIANVYPKGSPQDASTTDLLHTVRIRSIPSVDQRHRADRPDRRSDRDLRRLLPRPGGKLPLFIGVVVLLSFLLLMAVFRSLVIPATAAVMNLLSAGAAFGVVTAIFQRGWGASLIGVDKTGPIEAFLPVMMFPILFGLSMDYEVFLVSRIYEEWHRRRDNTPGGHPRPGRDRAHDHRRRGDHGARVRGVRARRRARHQAVRDRPRRRGAARRR